MNSFTYFITFTNTSISLTNILFKNSIPLPANVYVVTRVYVCVFKMNSLPSIQGKVEEILEQFGLEVHPFKVF